MKQIKELLSVQKEKPKLFYLRLSWVVPILSSALVAFVPFHGYTYLIAKLKILGFNGIDINPKLYDLVYYAVESIAEPFTHFIDQFFYNILKSILLGVPVTGLLFGLLMLLLSFGQRALRPRLKVPSSSEEYRVKYLRWFNNGAHSKKDALKLILATTMEVVSRLVGYFSALLFSLMLMLILFLFAISGTAIGENSGKKISRGLVCIDRDVTENELKRGFVFHCVEMVVDGEILKGRRVYSDDKSTFFITNDGAYQINTEGKVIYYRQVERLNVEGGSSD